VPWPPVQAAIGFFSRCRRSAFRVVERCVDIDVELGASPGQAGETACELVDWEGPGELVAVQHREEREHLVALDGFAVRVRGNKGPLCNVEDVNGEMIPDLVCQFEDSAPDNWSDGDTTATLAGNLLDPPGTAFEGIELSLVSRDPHNARLVHTPATGTRGVFGAGGVGCCLARD